MDIKEFFRTQEKNPNSCQPQDSDLVPLVFRRGAGPAEVGEEVREGFAATGDGGAGLLGQVHQPADSDVAL